MVRNSKRKYHYVYYIQVVDEQCSEYGKFYIGKRSCNKKPEKDLKYTGSGVVIKNIVNVHGKDSVKKTILFECGSEEEALCAEQELTRIYDAVNSPDFLNLCEGGRGPVGYVFPDEVKARKSASMRKSWANRENRGREVICITTNRVFADCNLGALEYGITEAMVNKACNEKQYYAGIYNDRKLQWMYFDKYILMTESERKQFFRDLKYKLRAEKTVICTSTGEVYRSVTEASIAKGVDGSHIVECCRGKRSYAGKEGTINLQWQYYDEGEEVDYTANASKVKYNRSVRCINTGKVYPSIKEACIVLGLSYKSQGRNIRKVCDGERKVAGKHPKTDELLMWEWYMG